MRHVRADPSSVLALEKMSGKNALMHAAAGGHARLALALLELGAPVSRGTVEMAATLEVRRLLEAPEFERNRRAGREQKRLFQGTGGAGMAAGGGFYGAPRDVSMSARPLVTAGV